MLWCYRENYIFPYRLKASPCIKNHEIVATRFFFYNIQVCFHLNSTAWAWFLVGTLSICSRSVFLRLGTQQLTCKYYVSICYLLSREIRFVVRDGRMVWDSQLQCMQANAYWKLSIVLRIKGLLDIIPSSSTSECMKHITCLLCPQKKKALR